MRKKKSNAGRPKSTNKLVTISVDVSEEEKKSLEAFAKTINASRSSQGRRGIQDLLLKFGVTIDKKEDL
jgi:hypothetical protein